MRTSDPAVFAVGECVEVFGQVYGLVGPLYEMANVLAATLCERPAEFTAAATATRLKVTGIDLYSAGDFGDSEHREDIVLRDDSAGIYRRVILEGEKVVGAVLYGDTSEGAWYFDLISGRVDAHQLRQALVFGHAYDRRPELEAYGGRCSVAG
jgi:nitrite reductase (NADH) large subunit